MCPIATAWLLALNPIAVFWWSDGVRGANESTGRQTGQRATGFAEQARASPVSFHLHSKTTTLEIVFVLIHHTHMRTQKIAEQDKGLQSSLQSTESRARRAGTLARIDCAHLLQLCTHTLTLARIGESNAAI